MSEIAPYLGKGHVVKEVKIGKTVCKICDDFCVSSNEVQKILDRIGEIAAKSYQRANRGDTA